MRGPVARATNLPIDRAKVVAGVGGGFESLSAPLRRDASDPLHAQLGQRIRAAIRDGRLRSGMRLSSTRRLASELGIARITVQTAYDQLVAEGYLVVDGRRATLVADDLPLHGFSHVTSAEGAEAEHFPVPNAWAPVAPITPAGDPRAAAFELGPEWFGLDTMDVRGWGRLLARAWRELATESDGVSTTYLGAIGDPRLRTALAGHLAVRRGVRCEPGSIALTAGSIAAFAAIARTWLGPGRVCIVEDPGGEQLRRAIGSSGGRIVPVPVDDQGLRVDRLPQRADAIFVTPSWQYPSGGSLSLARRLALLRWAADTGAIVIEDDCESELRYDGDPLPSLQGLAPDGRVIYVSTFSKVLFPGLRTGYMVLPSAHRELLLAAIEAGGRPPAAVDQRALALLIESGGFDRHVRRLRTTYAARRDALVTALAEIRDGLEVRRALAGGHLVIGIRDPRWTASELSAAVLREGVRVEPLSANRLIAGRDDELVVYLSRPDAATLVGAVRTIGRVMRRAATP